jgi:uncharacterized OB-fold protein
MTSAKPTSANDPEGIEFVEASWSFPQIYRADPLLLAFFDGLKQKRLLAGKAPGPNGRVIFPPTSFCETSYNEVTELVEVGHEGTIRTFTIMPGTPAKTIVFVQLAGADTASAGYLRGVSEGTNALDLVGAACRVVFADEPKGEWRDFWFELAG